MYRISALAIQMVEISLYYFHDGNDDFDRWFFIGVFVRIVSQSICTVPEIFSVERWNNFRVYRVVETLGDTLFFYTSES